MFRFGWGRFPIFPFALLFAIVAFGLVGPAGAALGFLLFFPLKLLFVFFAVGMMLRIAGGGSPWGRPDRRGRWAPPEPTKEELERAEAQRLAREEVDRLFPDL